MTTKPTPVRAERTPTAPAPWHVIPSVTFGRATTATSQSAVTRSDLAQTAVPAAETQLTLAAAGDYLRFGYGAQRVGIQILRPIVAGYLYNYPYYDWLLLPYVIGRGVIQGVTGIQFDGKPAPANIQHTVYTGTLTQTVNTRLQNAYLAQGIDYQDAMPGIAYGVLMIPPGPEYSFSQITIDVQWNKCYDPRNGNTGWTQNPALALADFITNPHYGRGEAIDWTTVIIAANNCDQVMPDGEPRRWFGLVVDRPQTLDAWEETLRAYAGVYVYREGGLVKFHVDTVEASSFAFTNSTPANYLDRSLKLRSKGRDEIPTVVTLNYTDTSTDPWGTLPWTEKAPGVDAGTVEFRESVIDMPGIKSHSFARRECLRHLNEYTTCDEVAELVATGEGIAVQVGEVVTLSDNAGTVNKPFRVMAAKPEKPGRWKVSLVEYQDAIYSDAVATGPQIPDTVFPLPFSPPAPTGLTLIEDVYQLQTGLFASRILVAWDQPTNFPFVSTYFVEVYNGDVLEDSGNTERGSPHFTTKALVENVTHTVNVYIISTTGAKSAAASASLTNAGKLALPSDVPEFSGLEVGGEVRLTWTPATDLDLTAHEVRYGDPSGSWATATLLDRIATPAVRYTSRAVPEGLWTFYIKGLDSVRSEAFPYGQESVNAATVDINVTSDANAFIGGAHSFTTPSLLQNMSAHRDHLGNTYWLTDMGDSWNSLFPGLMNGYTNVLAAYHTPGTSLIRSEHFDFGGQFAGDWLGSVGLTILHPPSAGPTDAFVNLDTSDGGYPIQFPTSRSQRTTARWGFTSAMATDIGTIKVTNLGEIHVSVVNRTESGALTLTSSQPLVVNLSGKYAHLTSLTIQPQGVSGSGAPATAYDRVAVNPSASGCLQMQDNSNATVGNHYSYIQFSSTARVIASGDFLEYEVMIPGNSLYADHIGGMDIGFTDATALRILGANDQNGDPIHTPLFQTRGLANGVWYSRKVSLAVAVGKTIATIALCDECNTPSAFKVALARNVRISDGASTVRQALWSSGAPPDNVLLFNNLNVNAILQQANSFDAYVYNSQTGAAIASNAFYSVTGV